MEDSLFSIFRRSLSRPLPPRTHAPQPAPRACDTVFREIQLQSHCTHRSAEAGGRATGQGVRPVLQGRFFKVLCKAHSSYSLPQSTSLPVFVSALQHKRHEKNPQLMADNDRDLQLLNICRLQPSKMTALM